MHADPVDIPDRSWIDRAAPAPARPYLRLMRLDRPIGTWLLLLPCWWGLALAAGATRQPAGAVWADLWPAALFGLGAVLMRGAGCTVNDVLDRDFDAKVARTRTRPIPSGAVNVAQALGFLVALLLASLVVLLQFNRATIALGIASLLLVFPYPLMKRVTWWPQFFLGLTFNWGALMGWSAVAGGFDVAALGAPLALYAAGICWTLGYDTIYAHQDTADDALIGVKSTARLFGTASRRWIAGFYGATMLLLVVAAELAGLGRFYLLPYAAAAAQLAWQVARLDPDAPHDCLAKFKSNRGFGLLVLAGLVLGGLVP
ncbi:MAG: 4-hydroxybenzoate octaprenyltransferase [Inquilinus sp.]|nr:4-hydroxybenzoate octaprenyltransferase [Inquilinus sp.]